MARWFFRLCLPLVLLSASIAGAVNCLWLYKYGFDKYDVSQTTGLEDAELEKAARGLISYFNSDEEPISVTVVKDGEPFKLFNQREIAHLADVKGLIRLDYWMLLGTSVYILGYSGLSLFFRKPGYRHRLATGVVAGSGLTLALMLALGLAVLLDFDRLFWQFHVISFSNDFWQLDPTQDYLIMLFPQGFWYQATIFCALATVAGAILLGGTAWYYRKRHKNTKEYNN